MNKNDILFVGVGQAGNNVVSELLKTNKRYNGLFINTSYDDIKGIENAINTYIIPGAGGTARNRNRAKMYAKNYIHSIVDKIGEFPMQRNVYFVFSFAGGSGSGITPPVISVLRKLNEELKINIIGILPSSDESKKAHENTLECWNELIKIDGIGSYYLIDNNKRDNKLEINKEFAELFNDFMNTTEANKSGVIDNAEIELLATTEGLGAIYRLNEGDVNSLADEISNSIFSVGGKIDCDYLGLSITPDYDYQSILDVYNVREDHFIGYTENNPLLIVSGIKLNNNVIKGVKNSLDSKIKDGKKIEEEEEEEDLEIEFTQSKKSKATKSKTTEKKKEKISIDELADEDDFWNSILNM